MTRDSDPLASMKPGARVDASAAVLRMTADRRRSADDRIGERILRLVEDRRPAWVFAYLALRDEVRLDGVLVHLVEHGIEVWLPRVVGGELRFGRWRPGESLSRDEEGVLAPALPPRQEWPTGVGLVLAPGRCFDRSGGRVGRGRGYYDRLLSRSPGSAVVVGVAYDCQVVERVPREEHDHDVDVVVTESEVSIAPSGRLNHDADHWRGL